MPRKTTQLPPAYGGEIIEESMESVMHGSMMPYAEYVILDRALPRVEDGLKPVQRRILYTMYELGLLPDKPHRKCARIVGDALGKYHPHGETSVYDALVRMSQGFVMRAGLVDGHGNFGSIDGDSAAAMRYTEARMTSLAMELLRDIEKDTVEYQLNFDDTLKEPAVLPGRFPNLLVNGASGIAVGLATNIPPHNLGEVIDTVVAKIDNPELTLKEAMAIMPGPDFPTGGYIISSGELERAYDSGRGKLLVRAKTSIESASNGKRNIVITELPYQVNKAALLERILKLSEDRKAILSGINDIRDESDRTGMRAVIEIKKDADAEKILQYLFKYTPLQTTFGVNMVAIVDGKPCQLGLISIIEHYISYQKDILTRRTKFELEAAKAREHILSGLIIAVEDIDRVIAIIKSSKNTREAKQRLIEAYKLSDIQAQAILDMRLSRLTNLEVITLKKEWEELRRTIARLEGILGSGTKLMRIIKTELLEIKEKYSTPRLTKFLSDEAEQEIKASDFIVVEDVFLTVSRSGYIKRYTAKPNLLIKEEAELKEGDITFTLIETKSDAKLLVITSAGNAYRIDTSAVPEVKPRDRGTALTTLCGGFVENEVPVIILDTTQNKGKKILFCMASGLVKAINIEDLIIKKSKYQACGLSGGDRVISVLSLEEGLSVMLLTKLGMSIHFSADSVPVTGRTAKGVKGIMLDLGDEVVSAFKVTEGEGELISVTDRGYAKRTLLIEYEMQNRNAKGLRNFKFKANASSGSHAVFHEYVKQPIDFVLFQSKSAPTRISSEALPIDSRNSQGRPVVMAIMDDSVTGGIKLL